jgi:hypothetical protein
MVRVNKPAFNLREKLSELQRPIGSKGNELMRSETVQDARDLVSAGRKNLIINGSFMVSQRSTSVTISGALSTHKTVDRFATKFFGGGWATNHSTESQSTDAPPGHSYSYKVLTNVAQNYSSSLGSWIQYSFEGNQLLPLKTANLGYKEFTVSFWLKSNKTGDVTVSSETAGQGHSFSTTVSINTANTWEYKTVTFPASPPSQLSEAEFRSIDAEFNIKWGLGSNGSWLVGTDESWQPSATNRGVLSSLQTNFQQSVNDYLAIGGIQMEAGSNATDFEHRPYGEELALCQRYYEKFSADDGNGGYATFCGGGKSSNTVIVAEPVFRVPKRAVGATMTWGGDIRMGGVAGVYDITMNSIQNAQLGIHGGYVVLVITSSTNPANNTDGYRIEGSGDPNAYIAFSSEL